MRFHKQSWLIENLHDYSKMVKKRMQTGYRLYYILKIINSEGMVLDEIQQAELVGKTFELKKYNVFNPEFILGSKDNNVKSRSTGVALLFPSPTMIPPSSRSTFDHNP